MSHRKCLGFQLPQAPFPGFQSGSEKSDQFPKMMETCYWKLEMIHVTERQPEKLPRLEDNSY